MPTQSVARISLDLNLLKDARWSRHSMRAQSRRMQERCFWARRVTAINPMGGVCPACSRHGHPRSTDIPGVALAMH